MDGYIRVSRVGGRSGDSFISPQVQRDAITRWASAHGVAIDAWHEDLDQSGGKMRRPAFDELLARIESRETDGVVVAKLDRFGRSLVGSLEALKRIDDAGAKFVSASESFDTSTPVGKLVMRMMLSLAEFELDRVRENWKVAQQRAVQRGIHIASKVPTGYVRGADGRLELHPEFADAVAEVFHMRAAGASWRELSAFLNARGVVGPYDSPHWRTRAVTHLITNPVYLGEARSGSFVNRGAHPAIVDRATWEAAQAARGDSTPRDGNGGALLSGLIRCAGCRYLMKADSMRLRDGTKARVYRCRGEHAMGTCESRAAALASVIEPFVVDRFFAFHGDLVGELTTDDDFIAAGQALVAAEAELDDYLANDALVSVVGIDRFNAGARTRQEAVERAARELAALRPATATSVDINVAWRDADTSQRRKLLASAFDAVILRSGKGVPISDRVVILRRGEMDDSFPRRGRRPPLRPYRPAPAIELGEDGSEGAANA